MQEYNRKRVEEGAVDEENNSADYTVGIFQSIGFKEFHDYLKLGTEEQKGPLGQKLFEEGKEQMMLATRQVTTYVIYALILLKLIKLKG